MSEKCQHQQLFTERFTQLELISDRAVCALRRFEFIKRQVSLLLQIWKSRLFNELKLLLWCASVTEPDVHLSVNHISAENVRLFPVWGIKVSSSGMFWFISLSAEGNGAFYAVLIRKRQSRKTGKPLWKKKYAWLFSFTCVCVSVIISLEGKRSVKGIESDISGHNLFLSWPVTQFSGSRGGKSVILEM